MAYFGSSQTATVADKHDGIFECASCGLKKGARARALGTHTAQSPYFLNESGAANRAVAEAQSEAAANAQLAFLLVPCPSCGERNPTAERAFIRSTITRCAMITGGALALCVFFAMLGLEMPSVIAGATALLGPIPHALMRRKAWREAADAVEFFEGEAPDRPFVGKPCVICAKKLVTMSEGTRCRLCGVALHLEKCWKRHARDAHAGETGT